MKPGTRIERWEIGRRLGGGGQAEVFEARHVELGLRGAVKVLGMSASAERLLTEGRVLARLQHPNLGRVLDVLHVDDRPVLVLEYVDGPSLAAWLAERRRPWAELAPIVAGVLDGVAAAHAVGVVHRDLKPANVMLAPGLVPKVLDFGIAHDPSVEGGTRTGAPMGTPRYMAPEQLRHAAGVDARADVWALGALIYEAATGRPPFGDDDLIGLHAAFLARAYIDPLTLAPELPATVAAAIRGALEPERAHRIPDVATLRAVLDGAPWAPAAPETTWDAVPEDTKPLVPGVVLGVRAIEGPLERWTARTPSGASATVRIGGGDVGERLRREAEVLQSLPGALRVVRALGAGTLADGRAWLATLDAPGTPLPTWSATRRTRDEVHAVIGGALETAAALHALSPPVWVRDWSPPRLAIAPDGPWLVELGLVRATPTDPLLGGATFEGDFGYLAPEQLAGDSDAHTDVWGIAALAVGLFTRKDPRVLRRGPALDYAGHADLPAAWRAALDAMLADDPAARPDAAVALVRWRALQAPPLADVPSPGRRAAQVDPAPAGAAADAGPRPLKEATPVAPATVEDFHRPPAVREGPAAKPHRASVPAQNIAGLVVLAGFIWFALRTLFFAPPAAEPPAPAPVAPVTAPAAALDDVRKVWGSDGTLTLTRGNDRVDFGAVPIAPKVKPVVSQMPRGVRNEQRESCAATILIDTGGVPIATQVKGCSPAPAEAFAKAILDWRYAPTGALTAQATKVVFMAPQLVSPDVAPTNALEGFAERDVGQRRLLWARPEFTRFEDYPAGSRPKPVQAFRARVSPRDGGATFHMAVDAAGRVVAVEVIGDTDLPNVTEVAAAEAATTYPAGAPRSFEYNHDWRLHPLP